MIEKIHLLWPEIALFVTTCFVMVLGQSRHRDSRDLCPWVAAIGLLVAGWLAWTHQPAGDTPLPNLPRYAKLVVCGLGLVMLLLAAGTADRDLEGAVDRGRPFEAIRSTRGEFYSFLLFSLTGLMLCASADDLVFLFLALELTSLPTYVMVTISTPRNRSMEAGVKYFFLGAMGAAVFLYGFAMIYGGTGHTHFTDIQRAIAADVAAHGTLSTLTLLGLVMAVLGVCFKIAAVPMHYYTPDVYQGASATVSGFLAFVPKAAGFFAVMLLCSLVGWTFGQPAPDGSGHLPETMRVMLWVIAALTMTVGNVLALVQRTSVKRILAYSSIAHSGYMLVGVVAGPGPEGSGLSRNGLSAVLFYLCTYGIMTVGAFAVVAALEKKGRDGTVEEADDVEDLHGLVQTRPVLGWTMVLSSVGLLGLPPLLGFLGKLPLFTSAIGAGEIALVLVLAANSAVAAAYYLRLAYACFIHPPETAPTAARVTLTPFKARVWAGVASMAGVVGLALLGSPLGHAAASGGRYRAAEPSARGAAPAVQPAAKAAETARAG
jgi:NADH-quinone oxidoreductase subunit N